MRRCHRWTAAFACLTIVIGAIGVPMPVRSAKVSAGRYPCENSPCGCADAATCWRDCCCKTNRQKLAWAAKNGVTPPAFVMAAANREAPTTRTCCAKSKPACCQTAGQSARPCCSTVVTKHRSKSVLLLSALRCRGITVSVGHLPPSLPPKVESIGFSAAHEVSRICEVGILYESPHRMVACPPPDFA